jgi:hypothetical protein
MLSVGGKVLTGESEALGEKFVPVPLPPPQVSLRFEWGRTWSSVVEAVDQIPEPWQFVREMCDFQKGVDDDQVLSGMTPY